WPRGPRGRCGCARQSDSAGVDGDAGDRGDVARTLATTRAAGARERSQQARREGPAIRRTPGATFSEREDLDAAATLSRRRRRSGPLRRMPIACVVPFAWPVVSWL